MVRANGDELPEFPSWRPGQRIGQGLQEVAFGNSLSLARTTQITVFHSEGATKYEKKWFLVVRVNKDELPDYTSWRPRPQPCAGLQGLVLGNSFSLASTTQIPVTHSESATKYGEHGFRWFGPTEMSCLIRLLGDRGPNQAQVSKNWCSTTRSR